MQSYHERQRQVAAWRIIKGDPHLADMCLWGAIMAWVTKENIGFDGHYSKNAHIKMCAGLRAFGVQGKDLLQTGLFGGKARTYSVFVPAKNESNPEFLTFLQEWDWKPLAA